MKGWLVTLADGRRFSWSEADGVESESQALAWTLMNARPGAQIESVEQETVLVVVPLSEN